MQGDLNGYYKQVHIVLTRYNDDLILSLKGSTDRITATSYFNTDAAGSYRLEELRFGDGTVLVAA